MNSISITGRLTANPQKRTAGELQVCDLRVAIARRRGRDGEDRGAVFIDVTTFGPLANVASQYLVKGRRVAVTGRLELDEWTAQDDAPRRRHKIVAEQLEFLDNGTPNGGTEEGGTEDGTSEQPVDKAVDHTESEHSESPVA